MAGIQQVRSGADDGVRWTPPPSTTTSAATTPGIKSKTHPPPLRPSIGFFPGDIFPGSIVEPSTGRSRSLPSPPIQWMSSRRKHGLQTRGSGGEDLRMTVEPCGDGGELLRITTLPSPGPQSPSARSQHYDPEYAKIEAWLDEHRDFAYDYFLRKATRNIVDAWLVSHASASSCGASGGGGGGCGSGGGSSGGNATMTPTGIERQQSIGTPGCSGGGGGNSGTTTPVRKISAHEFERGGLKPMVTTVDGTPTFLASYEHPDETTTAPVSRRRSRHELRQLDEKQLIFELVKDICNELDVRSLCHKILQNVSTLLNADRGSLFLVQGGGLSACQHDHHHRPMKRVCSPRRPHASITVGCLSKDDHSATTTATATSIASTTSSTISATTASTVALNDEPLHPEDRPAVLHPQQNHLHHIPPNSSHHLHHHHHHHNSNNNNNNYSHRNLHCQLSSPSSSSLCNERVPIASCNASAPQVAVPVEEAAVVGLTVGSPIGSTNVGSLQAPMNAATPHHFHGCQSKCLVSKLFDVCSRSTLQEMEKKKEIHIPWGTGIVGYVAESGEPVNIPDAYKDTRFNHDIDARTGYKTHSLLCMPIKDFNGEVMGVAQVINKKNAPCFTQNDEKVFSDYLQFCGIGLRNAQLYEKSQLEVKRNQVLLDLARMIFEEQSTIEHMVFRILTHTQSLIQCQRVQVLLLHEASKASFSRVFDLEANDLQGKDNERTSPFESRFPVNIGITGYVATTGETVNIANAYDDSRFDQSVDEDAGFKHSTVLCMPIKNSSGQIIGVIQLVNKFDDLLFTKNDENFVEAFAIFCGMGIHNTHMFEKAIIANAKQNVTLDVLSYHASASLEDAQKLRALQVPSAVTYNLYDFSFDDIYMSDDDTLLASIRMFMDMDLVEPFHIDYQVLCRWLLSVKKNYRSVTYHNWRHAFNVAQMMFSIITATRWWQVFGDLECLALIIACLCHDLDHRGTNNSFQIKVSSPLAQLYSTSTMEHHHFDQCLMILNSQGNQILGNLSPNEYSRVIKVLEDAILATDLAVYFRKRGKFLELVRTGMYDWTREEDRELFRAMLMTVCDLAAITKPWEIEKRVAELVTNEFFEQGDIERRKFNITPIDIMNREKEDQLPMMQVGFIDSICLPIYQAIADLSEKLEPLIEGVRQNKTHWLEESQQTYHPQRHN
ncbi:dual 3',5'-cyclic-AMP and -GMP phosphodiesterase 11 isoform X2 [Acyrthosiphon pisum]|uniref:Phosphodiesterase n=1 Tax=Acyrthosiphon pisum TaxID=7029 RepID=A0A8R1WAT5_ACYPI|nr:dual 3',5'-cyclic-AMP and -GMP phosphodiesterase 11 isoform X2 [Acyrthosiphon pisum]|eukprot:XP_003247299.1 PREDICTED: dual 3',5'-cyclic-AMP and -GMP phosphodiesterase 11-like isoform X1 [Acyrthosiphon pisum]